MQCGTGTRETDLIEIWYSTSFTLKKAKPNVSFEDTRTICVGGLSTERCEYIRLLFQKVLFNY